MSKKKRKAISWTYYIIFFVFSAFVVTCSFMLFFNYMSIDRSELWKSALPTFGNIMFLSLLFTLGFALYRKLTVERYIKRIQEGAERIMRGDFTARIKPVSKGESANDFDDIIKAFNKMAEELSGVETLRTDFVANVSHELKTPLAVMQNYGTLLQAHNLPGEKRMEYAKAITDASRRLSNLITNILKLNRLENQQIYPTSNSYNLAEQLTECLIAFENEWENKSIEIETDIDEDVIVNTDQELWSLVWNNLISNAIKFTPEGGTVLVGLKKESGYAVVTVSDTGCGMTTETAAHIFEKFYQGDTSHATQGNGLGLALVKRIAEITQSEISVKSELGKGSSFCVKIRI